MFSKPVHAVRVRGGPPGPKHDPFTVKPSSHHACACHPAGDPTYLPLSHLPPPVPPFLLTQNPHTSMQRLPFLHSVQA